MKIQNWLKNKMKKHYSVKNNLGGEFCKKCLSWSSIVGGLRDYECNATKEDIKNNKLLLKSYSRTK